MRLKFLADVVAGQSPPSDDVTDLSGGIPFLQGNAEFGDRHPTPKWQVENPPKHANEGDILISVRAPVGALNIANQSVGIGRGLAAVRAVRCDRGFLWWWFHTRVDLLDSESTGTTFKAIVAADLRNLEFPAVGLDEQRAIADYLDHETAQIDALVAKQEDFIGLLRERRRAATETAVAGVEPSGTRLKHNIRSVRQGWSPQCYAWPTDGVSRWAVLKAGAVNGGMFRSKENKELPSSETPRERTVVRAGDLVISRANTRELVGSAAVVDRDYPKLMLSDKLYAFDLDRSKALPRFVAAVLGSKRWRDLIEIEATGTSSSMLNIGQDDIVNLPLTLPAVGDQQAALDELDQKTTRIDALIAKAEEHVALAKERRAALITAAVTGQFNVPTARKAG